MTIDIALVQNGDDYAVYVRTPGEDFRYHLADHGTDASGNAQRMARVMMQATAGSDDRLLTIEDRPHLNAGGTWRESADIADFQAPTPEQRVKAEIANLRAEAARLRDNAGYAGSYDDGGASHYDDRADGMQHALDVLTRA